MEALQESVRLRAVGQHDPLVEYRREGHLMYQQLLVNYDQWISENESKFAPASQSSGPSLVINSVPLMGGAPRATGNSANESSSAGASVKVGRNDPCPCGSGKKYKKCHGR